MRDKGKWNVYLEKGDFFILISKVLCLFLLSSNHLSLSPRTSFEKALFRRSYQRSLLLGSFQYLYAGYVSRWLDGFRRSVYSANWDDEGVLLSKYSLWTLHLALILKKRSTVKNCGVIGTLFVDFILEFLHLLLELS